MKISELRKIIRGAKKEEVENMIVEMYKQIPKKIRDEKRIDLLISAPDVFKEQKMAEKREQERVPDFIQIEQEAKQFIKNAKDLYYISPNRIVPKKERSNWRFTAKRLVEQVKNNSKNPEHKLACAELMEEFYQLFVEASYDMMFVSDEPFTALGITQEEFFEQVILLKKELEAPDQWIWDSLNLIFDCDVDRDTEPTSLLYVVLDALDSVSLKEKAIEIAKVLMRERPKKRDNYPYSRSFEHESNLLTKFIFMTYSELGEKRKAVDFYMAHYKANNDEVALYVLLSLIKNHQNIDDWKEVYEQAVKRGIEPRKGLKRAYKHILYKGEFPEYIFPY